MFIYMNRTDKVDVKHVLYNRNSLYFKGKY